MEGHPVCTEPEAQEDWGGATKAAWLRSLTAWGMCPLNPVQPRRGLVGWDLWSQCSPGSKLRDCAWCRVTLRNDSNQVQVPNRLV